MRRLLTISILLILAIIAPLFVSSHWVYELTGVMIFAIAALGLNLITGYTGAISLGHNAFFALGAYVSVLSLIYLDLGYISSTIVGALVCFIVGVLVGIPAQRLRGLYLVLVTLILAMTVTPVSKFFRAYTGGSAGLLVDQPFPPEWFSLGPDAWLYYIALIVLLIIYTITWNLVGGSTARVLAGVRENELAASSMGVNIHFYKVLFFALGSALAGIGGALQAFMIGFIGPDSFELTLSIGFLAAVVVGGLGTISGALIAGFFLQFVPAFASDISQALSGAVYGGILILCMFLMPRGLAGSLRRFL